jgi:two-component system response regulator LytT
MELQLITNNISPGVLKLESLLTNNTFSPGTNISDDYQNFFQQLRLPWLKDLLIKLATSTGKKSFLVFKNNKYVNVLTENIAFFYIKYESPMIMCFDSQEYFVNYSLEELQHLLPAQQFYRLNRQYLINFNAVKEVEHYSQGNSS